MGSKKNGDQGESPGSKTSGALTIRIEKMDGLRFRVEWAARRANGNGKDRSRTLGLNNWVDACYDD